MGATAIRLTDIVRKFGPVVANDGASLEVGAGEIHALVGENGAGKSTLMRVLSGMYAPQSGRMEVNGRDVTGWSTAEAIASGVGMVHQHFMLVPTLTVAENRAAGRAFAAFAGDTVPVREVRDTAFRNGDHDVPVRIRASGTRRRSARPECR